MPVLIDSATSNTSTLVAAGTASNAASLTHNTNPAAVDVVAFAAVLSLSDAVDSAAVLAVPTWGGRNMALVPGLSAPVAFGTSSGKLAVYMLDADVPSGPQAVHASISGLTDGNVLALATVTYSGADQVGSAVVVNGNTVGATASNSVTVPSALPAHRVLTVHATAEAEAAVATARGFSDYSLTKRGVSAFTETLVPGVSLTFLSLLIGDAAGASEVTGTATQVSGSDWAAIGIPMSPAVVQGSASINIRGFAGFQARAGTFRTANPSPLRTWVIQP